MTDDLIGRQQAIDTIEKHLKWTTIPDYYPGIFEAVRGWLNGLPSAQPERPKGEWIHQTKFGRVECDQCGKVFRNSFTPKNFCPNCGADMRGEQE